MRSHGNRLGNLEEKLERDQPLPCRAKGDAACPPGAACHLSDVLCDGTEKPTLPYHEFFLGVWDHPGDAEAIEAANREVGYPPCLSEEPPATLPLPNGLEELDADE